MAHRFFGWKRQGFDARDPKLFIDKHALAAAPTTVNLVGNTGPYLNQANEGSCGPNTVAEGICYDQKVEGLPVVVPSRNFIYWNTRFLMGTVDQDSGVDNRRMMQALATYGFCGEHLWPYNPTNFKTKPTVACFTAALANKIQNYAAVAKQLGQMQGVLARGRPFVYGFDCFQQIMSDQAAANGIITDPAPGASPIGGHDMLAVGYNATGKPLPGIKKGNFWPAGTFRIRQHWVNDDGTPWGDGGYGYVSFAYATGQYADDFWVINAVPNVVSKA